MACWLGYHDEGEASSMAQLFCLRQIWCHWSRGLQPDSLWPTALHLSPFCHTWFQSLNYQLGISLSLSEIRQTVICWSRETSKYAGLVMRKRFEDLCTGVKHRVKLEKELQFLPQLRVKTEKIFLWILSTPSLVVCSNILFNTSGGVQT